MLQKDIQRYTFYTFRCSAWYFSIAAWTEIHCKKSTEISNKSQISEQKNFHHFGKCLQKKKLKMQSTWDQSCFQLSVFGHQFSNIQANQWKQFGETRWGPRLSALQESPTLTAE